MATVTKPIALDESLNTTELSPRNIADVLADELGAIAGAISRIAPQTVYDELSKLEDVTLTSPTNGQILKYNSVSQKWENGNESGGGGDTVTWTQIVGSGTKIAEIDINGTSTDVYAPSGGSGTISLIVTCDSALEGETLTLTGGSVLTAVVPAGLVVTFTVPSLGTWVLTNSLTSDSQSITMDYYGNYYATVTSIPDGSTVTPTDDVLIWQKCGATGTTYATISDVLNDTATLIALMSSDNAVDYLVRSTTWTSAITTSIDAMKAIGASDYCSNTLISDNTWNTAIQNSTYFEYVDNYKNPIMTSNTTPEGEAFLSKKYSDSFGAWKAFDYDTSTSAIVLADPNNATGISYIGYVAPIPYVLKMAKILNYGAELVSGSHTIYVQGSDDGVTWGNLASDTFTQTADVWENILLTSNVTEHSQHRIYGEPLNYGSGNYHFSFKEIQFYGRTIGGVQTWLRSAGITNKTYTTLAEVLADSTTLSALMADHNAVDYLVTAKAWASTICADSTAMSYIGLNNYASNTLLADSTWCNAICNSTYFESVLNVKVPAMTSNTAPEGICSATLETGGPAYKAFDGDLNTYWGTSSTTSGTVYYEFTKAVTIYLMTYAGYGSSYGANSVSFVDGNNTVIKTQSMQNITGAQKVYIGPNSYSNKKYGCRVNGTFNNQQASAMEVQFYSREDV